MPKPPVPPRLVEVLKRPNPAVLGSVRPDGTPHTSACWYLWDDGRVLLTFDRGRTRLGFIRSNPAVSITVLDRDDWYLQITLLGRAANIYDDEGLKDADRISTHYLGGPYPDRAHPRVTGVVEIEKWFVWDSRAETPGVEEALSTPGTSDT
jgi:PPOX class probable F420-dependent enzyme